MVQDAEILDLVITIPEVQERFFYSMSAIHNWINTEKVKSRKACGVWLLDLPSVIAHVRRINPQHIAIQNN